MVLSIQDLGRLEIVSWTREDDVIFSWSEKTC